MRSASSWLSVLRAHLGALCERVDLLAGGDVRAFVDIDSLLRPVYGYAKQGASYGHTKIAGKQVLRKGLSPLAATISTDSAAPVIAGMRLRAGRAGSGEGAARMVAQVIATARGAGATGTILVRGDGLQYPRGDRGLPPRRRPVLTGLDQEHRSPQSDRGHRGQRVMPVRYPVAVRDPDTGEWISDAEVAEIPYTAFASTTPVTARLIVRRVKDPRHPDTLFPVWRYHLFFTNSTEPAADADITHHRHAIIETVFADLIDGPLAHMPSGRQQRLGAVRRDRPQPAARRRNARRWPPRRRPRGHPAPQDRQHFRPPGPPTTTTRPAPTQPLALAGTMASVVAQHHRPPPTTASHTSLTTAERPDRSTRKAGQTSKNVTPTHRQPRSQTTSTAGPQPIGGFRLSPG